MSAPILVYRLLAVAAFALISGCKTNAPTSALPPLILKYPHFGPQAASHSLIGYEWYQWNSQGPDDPSEADDVRVVIYRNAKLQEIVKLYPVIPHIQDYRYLSYEEALAFIDRFQRDEVIGKTLRDTRRLIYDHFKSERGP